MAGFESVDDFYRDCSSLNYLDGIQVPMIFINAEDDPIVPRPLLDHMMEAISKIDHLAFFLSFSCIADPGFSFHALSI